MSIKLPEEFENRMKQLLGDEYQDFRAAYEDSNYHGLRINPLKVDEKVRSVEEVIGRFGVRQVPWCKLGYYYDEESRPGRHPLHHAGAYYIQEPSAMLVGEIAKASPGIKVLDLCAAPGGKTSHLAGAMMGEGVLVANEIVPQRAKILSQNVERMGIRNCIVTNESPDRLSAKMPGYFDLVVVDTPCSGEGMFRRDEIARTEWSPENVTMCADRGQDILNEADHMLKVGGKLVYSTCTFAPDEDELAIERFINNHPVYTIEKVELKPYDGASKEDGWISEGQREWSDRKDPAIENTIRLWPHKLHGEGHFAAVLRKGEIVSVNSPDVVEKNKKNSKDGTLTAAVKLYNEFEKKYLNINLDGNYMMFGDNLYLVPKGAPSTDRLRVERMGLQLGEIKKGRFEPAHALGMSLRCDETVNCLEVNEDDALKYLKGESISCDTSLSGWCLISIQGFSLGFGKAVNGQMKNHYPKGLRIMM